MSKKEEYIYNPDTLSYEEHSTPRARKIGRTVLLFLCTVAMVCVWFWLFFGVFGIEPPKTRYLRARHTTWESRMNVLKNRLDVYERTLTGIEDRDDEVYRSLYGVDEIPDEVKFSGIAGDSRYAMLDIEGANSDLKSTVLRLDKITKRAYVQSKSLDEVVLLARQAGDMVSCVPSVPPVLPDLRKVRLSSGFGYRTDPVYGGGENHGGQDFAADRGYPVYATGDAVVETSEFKFNGYGNEIVLDHGYGYKTRYAHLLSISVTQGMKVRRGQKIGEVGNTGKTTGPHLHYEVIYRGNRVNPMNFMDFSMPLEEYRAMIDTRASEDTRGQKKSTSELLRRRNTDEE